MFWTMPVCTNMEGREVGVACKGANLNVTITRNAYHKQLNISFMYIKIFVNSLMLVFVGY